MTGARSVSETVSGDSDGDKVRRKAGGDENCTDIEMVCRQCFKFLRALAKDCVEVQKRCN